MLISRSSGGVNVPAAAAPAGFFVDFTALAAQDPLSAGGTWSNNTQGVGGNTAPLSGTSMRIAARTGGGGNLACGSVAAQVNYEDSFAFVPGLYSGTQNVRLTATLFVASGYAPTDNHELILIMGAKTALNYQHWVHCLWSIAGAQQLVVQDGDFGVFTDIGGGTGLLSGGPANGDKMVAEIYPATTRARWGRIRSGVTTWAHDATSALIDNTLGTGMGICAFRRFAADSVAESFGFTDMTVESF